MSFFLYVKNIFSYNEFEEEVIIMKVKVNSDACIGCGACTAIAPEVFELNDEGLSTCIVDEVDKDNEEN